MANLPDDLEKLGALHKEGKLSDAEFAKAKQRMLETKQLDKATAAAKPPAPRAKFPWRLMFLTALIASAYLWNPDQASLERGVRSQITNALPSGLVRKNTPDLGGAVVQTHYENYYLFSLGTVTIDLPSPSLQVKSKYVGAFGRWWWELPVSQEQRKR